MLVAASAMDVPSCSHTLGKRSVELYDYWMSDAYLPEQTVRAEAVLIIGADSFLADQNRGSPLTRHFADKPKMAGNGVLGRPYSFQDV